MHTTDHTLVTDLLTVLKVPYTKEYTRQRFETMPFKTLFGVSQLLKEYGVESKGYQLQDKTELLKLSVPFITQTQGGLVIVTKISSDTIDYLTQGVSETIPVNEFEEISTGVVLLPLMQKGAKEPEYNKHLTKVIINSAKNLLLLILAGLLSVYLIVIHDLWHYWSFWGLFAVDCFGIWLTYMLVQKSLSIKSHVADKVCGVLQEGGCDSILKTSASSFFGIFSWSEVGFTYFGVSLLAMLIFPGNYPLAFVNQYLLPAFHDMEHQLSKICSQALVHFMCLRTSLIMVAIYLLSFRWLDETGVSS